MCAYALSNFSLYDSPFPSVEMKSMAADTPAHDAWFNVPVSIM